MSRETILWDGIVEKKGRDFFSRWSKRKVTVVGDECRYFDADGVVPKGVIKLVDSTTITVNGSVVSVKTVGRPEKKRGRII